jgi:hypothetical protein
MYRLIIILWLLAMTGCASIAGEKTQPITVQTIYNNSEVAGIGCTLSNDDGTWFLTSPASVTVHKSTGDLAVDCKKDDMAGHQTLVSKSNGAVWGNIIAGGGIGYLVDRNTGAGFDYPATVTVILRKIGVETSPASTTSSAEAKPSATAVASKQSQ